MTDRVLDALRGSPELFDRGEGEMVAVDPDGRIHPAGADWLADHLGRICAFERWNDRAKRSAPCDPPGDLAKTVLALKDRWGLRRLAGVATAPILRPDGTALGEPGYDAATGLLLVRKSDEAWPAVPDRPSRKDAVAALKRLWRPFGGFPFAKPADRAAMSAALLTAFVRPGLNAAPGILFEAPTAGSGKTLLARCLSILAGDAGVVLPVASGDELELKKALFAELRSARRAIVLDNVSGLLRSPALEAMLTAERYSDRVLGLSLTLTFPTNVLVVATGNNLMLGGDLWRGVIVCRLDPGCEDPERRHFDLDPLDWCKRNRVSMATDALTILRAYAAAGRPQMTPDRLASFEAWSDLVRAAVIWLGEADPTACLDERREKRPSRSRSPGS